MTLFNIWDLAGTASFAVSGALFAINKKMDGFGIFVIAFVTAVGGGTLRDVLIDTYPITWMSDLNYVYTIFVAVVLAIVLRKKIGYLSRSLFLFDAIGLGIFTIIGTEIGLQKGFHPIICVSLGMITATFGGVIRDTLSNESPLIFHREIYVTACILGASTYILLSHLHMEVWVNQLITTLMVIAVRLIAVRLKWQLPTFYQ